MNTNYRAWLDKKIAQQKRKIAALLKKPDTDANGRQLNLLQDELLDYRMALVRFMEFERETRLTAAPLTATPALLAALQGIVTEVMDYPPVPRHCHDSYLPRHLIKSAQAALLQAGVKIKTHKEGGDR